MFFKQYQHRADVGLLHSHVIPCQQPCRQSSPALATHSASCWALSRASARMRAICKSQLGLEVLVSSMASRQRSWQVPMLDPSTSSHIDPFWRWSLQESLCFFSHSLSLSLSHSPSRRYDLGILEQIRCVELDEANYIIFCMSNCYLSIPIPFLQWQCSVPAICAIVWFYSLVMDPPCPK